MPAPYPGRIGAASVWRETSTVFVALIVRVVLGNKGRRMLAARLALIAGGAVVMEWGG